MTVERLRSAVTARPFIPFTIVTGDGSRYHVSHPEMVAIAPKAERTFIVAHEPESHAVLDLLLVTALEFGQSQSRQRRKAG